MKIKKLATVGSNCVACGSCIKACPMGAIEVKLGVMAYVNPDKCVGCGLCARTCPAGVIDVVKVEE